MTEQNTPQQKQFRILLIGDHCDDVYQYGIVERISPEAPVPVFLQHNHVIKPGMAGNVCENLKALGCDVTYLHGETSIKTRLIDSRSKQHIVRIDEDVISNPIIYTSAFPALYDAIVISDYNKGTVTYELIEELRREFKGPIFVDTKKTDLSRLEGCFVKINTLEYSKITSTCSNLIVTAGAEGAYYNGTRYPTMKVEVADVCGAGDTFLSALTYQYLLNKDMECSIPFAIRASEITVQHIGVYAPDLGEINAP
jgi:D-beta-D-heptose 7-phosphate kinase/D-beta-D-heptose 1-phosphate adenosyltransferase